MIDRTGIKYDLTLVKTEHQDEKDSMKDISQWKEIFNKELIARIHTIYILYTRIKSVFSKQKLLQTLNSIFPLFSSLFSHVR